MRVLRTAPLLAAVLLAGCGGAGSAGPAAPPASLVAPATATPADDGSTAGTDALGSAILHGRPLCSLPEAAGVSTFVLPGDGTGAEDDGLASCAEDGSAALDRTDATRPAGATKAARAPSR